MVDNIKILVYKVFDKTLMDNSRIVKGKKYKQYLLYNASKDHSLTLTITDEGTIIEGSWRKWYWGAKSLEDLTPALILKVIVMICQATKLRPCEVLDARILKMEFGAVFNLPIYPSTIIKSMFRYSSFDTGRYETYISFRGHDYWLTAYDKVTEINKDRRQKVDKGVENNINALRIELKINKATAFRNKMRGIKTVRDIFRQYRLLIVSFLNEIKKIEIEPINPVTDDIDFGGSKKKDLRQYWMFFGIRANGAQWALKYIKQLNISRGAKTEMRKEVRQILARYDIQGSYNKNDFINNVIKKQLAKNISEKIPRVWDI